MLRHILLRELTSDEEILWLLTNQRQFPHMNGNEGILLLDFFQSVLFWEVRKYF